MQWLCDCGIYSLQTPSPVCWLGQGSSVPPAQQGTQLSNEIQLGVCRAGAAQQYYKQDEWNHMGLFLLCLCAQ